MNTKAIFTIVAIMAAVGVLGMHAIPSVPHAMGQGVQANNNNHGASLLADDNGQGDNNNQGEDGDGNRDGQ